MRTSFKLEVLGLTAIFRQALARKNCWRPLGVERSCRGEVQVKADKCF